MPVLNGDEIYQGLLSDPCFVSEQPKSTYEVWYELCKTIPNELGDDFLERKVTVETFLQVRLLILRHLIVSGWKNRILRAHYLVELEMMDGLESVIHHYQELNLRFIHGLSAILGDVPGFLTRHTITEREFLVHPQVGRFNDTTIAQWDKGELTFSKLLRLQPRVLFKNSD